MDIAGAGGKCFNSTASPPPCWAAMVESRCPALLRSVFFRGLGYQGIATGGNWLTQKYLWQQGGIAAPLNLRDGQSSCTGLQPQRCSGQGTILQKLFDIWGSNMQSEQLARNLSLGLGRLWTICNLCTNKPPGISGLSYKKNTNRHIHHGPGSVLHCSKNMHIVVEQTTVMQLFLKRGTHRGWYIY